MRNLLLAIALLLSLSPSSYAGRLQVILDHATNAQNCHVGLESVAYESLESLPVSDPDLTIKTERFTLKPLTVDDFDALFPIFNNEKVQQMSGDILDRYTLQTLLAMGSQNSGNKLQDGTIINFGIYDGKKLIGMTQLGVTPPEAALSKGIAKPGETWVEVSYHLDPSYWGKGVAPEVAKATTALAFNKYHVDGIHGQTIASNDRSGKVLEKLGMSLIDSRRFPSASGKVEGSNYYAMRRPSEISVAKLIKPEPRMSVKGGLSAETLAKVENMRLLELPFPHLLIEKITKVLMTDTEFCHQLKPEEVTTLAEQLTDFKNRDKTTPQVIAEFVAMLNAKPAKPVPTPPKPEPRMPIKGGFSTGTLAKVENMRLLEVSFPHILIEKMTKVLMTDTDFCHQLKPEEVTTLAEQLIDFKNRNKTAQQVITEFIDSLNSNATSPNPEPSLTMGNPAIFSRLQSTRQQEYPYEAAREILSEQLNEDPEILRTFNSSERSEIVRRLLDSKNASRSVAEIIAEYAASLKPVGGIPEPITPKPRPFTLSTPPTHYPSAINEEGTAFQSFEFASDGALVVNSSRFDPAGLEGRLVYFDSTPTESMELPQFKIGTIVKADRTGKTPILSVVDEKTGQVYKLTPGWKHKTLQIDIAGPGATTERMADLRRLIGE